MHLAIPPPSEVTTHTQGSVSARSRKAHISFVCRVGKTAVASHNTAVSHARPEAQLSPSKHTKLASRIFSVVSAHYLRTWAATWCLYTRRPSSHADYTTNFYGCMNMGSNDSQQVTRARWSAVCPQTKLTVLLSSLATCIIFSFFA